jgi:phosphatidylserine decarboxylase
MRWQTLRESRWIVAVLVLLGAGAWFITPWLALGPAAMLVFTLCFFRDPHRAIPGGDRDVVSPADGRITDIIEIEENEVTGTRMQRIGIFLSVFDVHVNRAPLAGRVIRSTACEGAYHDARSPMASTHNVARTWGFDCAGTTLVVRQITGAIARRIVPWAAVGDRLQRGQHFGMIRFGSRTEIYLPLDARVVAETGQHVRGGSTILATLPAVAAQPATTREAVQA